MKRYDSKYFGISAGIFSILIYILAVIKSFYKGEVINYLKPFIPFYDITSFINVLGGIIMSFIWGFALGYFFVLVYTFFDKKFSSSLN